MGRRLATFWCIARRKRSGGVPVSLAAFLRAFLAVLLAVLAGAASVGVFAGAGSAAPLTQGGVAEAGASAPRPVSWPTAGFDAMRSGYNGLEKTLGPANVGRIHLLWRDDLGVDMIAQPVEAAGVRIRGKPTNVIYEGTEHGDFYALRASNGHVIWHAALGAVATACKYMPDGVFGIGDAAAIRFTSPGAGVVYVLDGAGELHALDLATGAEQPGWPVRGIFTPKHEATYGGLNLFHGHLYATAANHCGPETPYSGRVVEVDVAAHKVVHRFFPDGPPSGGVSGGGIWGPGGVGIDPSNQDVYAGTGPAIADPETYRYSDAVVQLTRSLHLIGHSTPPLDGLHDVDVGSTPVLFRPAGCPRTLAAAKDKDGILFVYAAADVGAGPVQQFQIANTRGAFNGDVAWDPVTGMLYVSNPSNPYHSHRFRHGLVALRANRCHLTPAWNKPLGTPEGTVSPPSVANGVVYYGDGLGDEEFAVDAASGKLLWSDASFGGPLFAPPTIVNGELLVASWDDYLYAFGLGGS